jgi:hypothetical protein
MTSSTFVPLTRLSIIAKSKTKLAIANMVVTHIVNHNCYDNMAGKSDIKTTPGDKSTKNKVKYRKLSQ